MKLNSALLLERPAIPYCNRYLAILLNLFKKMNAFKMKSANFFFALQIKHAFYLLAFCDRYSFFTIIMKSYF